MAKKSNEMGMAYSTRRLSRAFLIAQLTRQ
jgi:hypothetical protein